MKRNPVKRKRQRILLLFLLGVGVPSILLGYLAFRGIQNDQALLEKENREELKTYAEKVIAQVDRKLTFIELNLIEALNRVGVNDRSDSYQILQPFKENNPHIEEIFIYAHRKGIQYPLSSLLYKADGRFKAEAVNSQNTASFQSQLREVQQLEFQSKKYGQAAGIYRRLASQVQNKSLQGELMNSVARTQKKANLISEAKETYKQLILDYDEIRSSSGIPLGLVAACELTSLQEIEDAEKSLRSWFDILNNLIANRWDLERAEYNFFSSKVKTSIDKLLQLNSLKEKAKSVLERVRSLEETEDSLRASTERLLLFQEKGFQEIQEALSDRSATTSNQRKRISIELSGQSYFISLVDQTEGKPEQERSFAGLIFRMDKFDDGVIRSAVQSIIPSDSIGWLVRDENGVSLSGSKYIPADSIVVKTAFIGDYPKWSLELYRGGPRIIGAFLTSRRGIYFLIFLLLGGILVFGLVLTIRTVSQEMELSRMKSDFVSTISHEFKSPLTSIRQLSEMLQSNRVPSEERRRKYYDVLVEQSERLTRLTENVLEFAKFEEGRKAFQFTPVDITEILEDIILRFQERVRHEGFDMELHINEPLPALPVDRDALSQAINNLLDNAVKYSGDSRKVIVTAVLKEPHIVLSVQDFGIGIKEEDQGKIFERFLRGGDELTRTVKGSGLGLTLVKQTVDAHKGSIRVESMPGKGSTFSIRLPLKRSKER